MLVEQLIRETLELQGFRIESVDKAGSELIVTLVPDLSLPPSLRGMWQSRRLPGYAL